MTWRAVIYGLAAWWLAAWSAAAQDIPGFEDVLVRPIQMAGRVFHHDDGRDYAFVVVRFLTPASAAESLDAAAEFFAGFIADRERTTTEPDVGDAAVAMTGKTPYGHAAVLLVQDRQRLLVGIAMRPAGDPLPGLLAVVEPLSAPSRPLSHDLFDHLPSLRDLPPGFVMQAEHERRIVGERLATPVP